MSETNKNNNSSKSFLKKLFEGFINFCRKIGPAKVGIDPKRVKQLSFDSLRLIGNRQKKIEEINQDASLMIKEHINDVNGLLRVVELSGTKVIKHKNADKALQFLGEVEGFLPPITGLKGKLILLGLKMIGAWNEPFPKETPCMFVFGDKEPPMGYMIHQIHHWLSYNKGMPGYTEETMSNFKRIFEPSFGMEDVKRMSKEEIIALREAIARDQEALDFVQKMAMEIFKPQDVVKGIKDGDKKNI